MAYNEKNGQSPYYDNSAYAKDGSEVGTSSPPPSEYALSLEPAPKQFLPRIITGSEIGGEKHKPEGSPPPAGFQPKFTSEPNEKGEADDEAGEGRDTWDRPIEFLLSCISMSVGLGNVWRFPGVAARNGGGAFLIPYLIVLLVIGRPLYYLEMCIGQFSQYGQVKVWNMAPIFKGVGYGGITGVIAALSYYCALMALAVFYFFASFQKTLPWAECQDEFPQDVCAANLTDAYAGLYFGTVVFPSLPNIDDGLGKIHWRLALCLIFSWLLICLSLIKGVKSSGKVAYFTAIFPYVVLLILLIRGVTLKGAGDGIKYFLEPQWESLYDPKVWYAAVEQCFFSLTTAFGPIIMFASYNPFHKNVYKDALIISFTDTFTSLLAGITIFAVMGNLVAETPGMTFADIPGGPGLAFILYPQAIAKFTWAPQLFAVLFFLMLFTLGVGSATSLAGGIITLICDQFTTWKRWLVTVVVCICGVSIGLLYVNEGGLFMIDLIDHYGAGFIIYVMAMAECAGIAYCYGLSNICDDIEFMTGRHVGLYWRVCWAIVIPIGLFGNLLYYLITSEEFMSGTVAYPKIATVFGWMVSGFAVAMIPIWGFHAVATRKASSWSEKLSIAMKPTPRWGPQKTKLRREWQEFRAAKASQNRKPFIYI